MILCIEIVIGFIYNVIIIIIKLFINKYFKFILIYRLISYYFYFIINVLKIKFNIFIN
jgi:hypothetical protein